MGLPWIMGHPKETQSKKEGKTIKSVSELEASVSQPWCAHCPRQQPNCETYEVLPGSAPGSHKESSFGRLSEMLASDGTVQKEAAIKN